MGRGRLLGPLRSDFILGEFSREIKWLCDFVEATVFCLDILTSVLYMTAFTYRQVHIPKSGNNKNMILEGGAVQ
jgi:hypothetical protein